MNRKNHLRNTTSLILLSLKKIKISVKMIKSLKKTILLLQNSI